MLPRTNRVLTGDEFRQVFRGPVRRNAGWASFHLIELDPNQPSKFGFVVGSAVGNAVMRNRIKRRLRSLAANVLRSHPYGFKVVVRCYPQAKSIEYQEMRGSFESLMASILNSVNRGE